MKKALFVVAVLFVVAQAYAQQINTMISSGMDFSMYSAISPNNKYVAKMNKSKATIWDFKTGRLVREIQFSTTELSNYMKENVPDSISFSADDDFLHIYRCGAIYPGKNATKSPTITEINIETGIAGKEELNSNPVRNIDSLKTDFIIKLIGNNDTFVFKSPNGKNEVIYQNCKVDKKSYSLNLWIRKNGILSELMGRNLTHINYVFSSDSRYLFTNNFIYDFLLNKKVCELKSVPFISYGCGVVKNSNVFYTAAKDEIIFWDFPGIKRLKTPGLSNIVTSNNGKYLAYSTSNVLFESNEGYLISLMNNEKVGQPMPFHPNEYETIIEVSDDGKFLLTSSRKGNRIYNSSTGQLVRYFPEFSFMAPYTFLNNSEVIYVNNDALNVKYGEITKYNIYTDANEIFDIKEMLSCGENEAILFVSRLKKDHLIISTFSAKKI